jgi:hypothetical protein
MIWRQLDEDVQRRITNEKNAIAFMMEKNNIIKRPWWKKMVRWLHLVLMNRNIVN